MLVLTVMNSHPLLSMRFPDWNGREKLLNSGAVTERLIQSQGSRVEGIVVW
jgi:hypothetical protein